MVVIKYFIWFRPDDKSAVYEVMKNGLVKRDRYGKSHGLKKGRIVSLREAMQTVDDYGLNLVFSNEFGCIWK